MKITDARMIGEIDKHVSQLMIDDEVYEERAVLWATVGMKIDEKWYSASLFKKQDSDWVMTDMLHKMSDVPGYDTVFITEKDKKQLLPQLLEHHKTRFPLLFC
jgi:hypothetical protein